MSDLQVIEELQAYLISQGVVRAWGATPNGLPQCILAPRDGAPEAGSQLGTSTRAGGKNATAPENYEAAIVTIAQVGQVPPIVQQEFLEDALIECVTRAYRSVDAIMIQRRIREQLNGLRLFTMGSLIVEWSRVFAGDQPLGSDETDYTRMQTFLIQARVRSLAGQPYWA